MLIYGRAAGGPPVASAPSAKGDESAADRSLQRDNLFGPALDGGLHPVVRTEPTPIIETTVQGIIEWCDEAASQLLNISHRACRGRELLPFFAGDRHVIAEAISRAGHGQEVQGEAMIRPRDRKPVPVAFQMALIVAENGQYLRWTFSRQ